MYLGLAEEETRISWTVEKSIIIKFLPIKIL